MFFRLLTRALAAVLPHEEYLLPRWIAPSAEQNVIPLREIVIHRGQGRFAQIISLV